MNKTHLAARVAAETGLSRTEAAAATASMFAAVANALAAGERVVLPGFGRFEVARRAARQGRNPNTGAPVLVPASSRATFKASKALKDALNPPAIV